MEMKVFDLEGRNMTCNPDMNDKIFLIARNGALIVICFGEIVSAGAVKSCLQSAITTEMSDERFHKGPLGIIKQVHN
ncbi:hypothetical protein AC249_AIPGENE6196 [Exaiptasia diaphana]|nr:hypothetical protein AC249_AIPGENE6196 [Exaiptasia diaphana]